MAGLRRGWLTVWYGLLLVMLSEVVIFGLAAGAAAYCRQALHRDFAAGAAVSQEVDKVPFATLINSAARQENVSARLVAAMIQAESSFNPRAMSPAGAAGLMQVIPGTWRQVNGEIKACVGRHSGECSTACYFTPELNIRIGTAYLSRLEQRYNGDALLAVAAYNAGPGMVDQWSGVPPFAETQLYVERVMINWYELGKQPLPAYGLAAQRLDHAAWLAGWSLAITLTVALYVARRLAGIYRSWRWGGRGR